MATKKTTGAASGGKGGGGGGRGANKSASKGSTARRSAGGSASETGERDETYNLVSVLYHALQGAETYGQYVADAEQAGDQELTEFFAEVQQEEQERATRAKTLLAARLGGGEDEEG